MELQEEIKLLERKIELLKELAVLEKTEDKNKRDPIYYIPRPYIYYYPYDYYPRCT